MEVIEVAKTIIGILDVRKHVDESVFPVAEVFYGGSPPRFDQEHVNLLLRLENKIEIQGSRNFFWYAIGWSIFYSTSKLAKFRTILRGQSFIKLTNVTNKNSDICLMTYLRANRIDEALDGLIGKWSRDDIPLTSIKLEILRCLRESLDNEPYQFNSKQFDKIEKLI